MVKSREVLNAAKYMVITWNEVTTLDNQSLVIEHGLFPETSHE
jgi:hypothetical protein